MKLKFPSGRIGYEIRYYMGLEDPLAIAERPEIVQEMYKANLCQPGKTQEYTDEQLCQLRKEVINALDIKEDHIDTDKGSSWTPLQHYHLKQFYKKIQQL